MLSSRGFKHVYYIPVFFRRGKLDLDSPSKRALGVELFTYVRGQVFDIMNQCKIFVKPDAVGSDMVDKLKSIAERFECKWVESESEASHILCKPPSSKEGDYHIIIRVPNRS